MEISNFTERDIQNIISSTIDRECSDDYDYLEFEEIDFEDSEDFN